MNKPIVLFYDPCCPKPYNSYTPIKEAMGGTESSTVTVAEAIARELNAQVFIMQHNRENFEVNEVGVSYIGKAYEVKPDTVVLLRVTSHLKELKERWPNAKYVVWMHDVAMPEQLQINAEYLKDLTIVGLSDWHVGQINTALKRAQIDTSNIRVQRNYYIFDVPTFETKEVDKNKLVFFSSPHKGLQYTVEGFSYLKKTIAPDAKLYIANPGYLPFDSASNEDIINLGAIPKSEILKHVNEAFCVFYLNDVFPETFGLVYAEANALGTPVLTAAIGAASEVLDHPQQTVEIRDKTALLQRFATWMDGAKPKVKRNYLFKNTEGLGRWRRILGL
jgi:glycosyltransferase involved in cell wall biosynthesis